MIHPHMMVLILSLVVCIVWGNWHVSIAFLLALTPFIISKLYTPILSIRAENYLLVIDNLSVAIVCLSVWITALVLIVSTYILHRRLGASSFHFLCLSQCFLLVLCFRVHNLLFFYFLFESCVIPTFLIIIKWGVTPEGLRAAIYIFIYTICASLPLLLGLLYIYYTEHTISFLIEFSQVPSFIMFIILLAFMVKLPLYLFHLWLPKAHVEAPVGGSIFLAGVLLKLGPYGLYRIISITHIESFIIHLLSTLSLFGALISAIICLRLTDIKMLVAYASVSHIGFTIVALLRYRSLGILGAKLILIAHGLSSSLLFALVNFYYEWTHTRSIIINRGMLHAAPSLALWWFIGIAANIAVPPFLNMLSEVFIISGLISVEDIRLPLMPWLIIIYSVLTLLYRLNLYTNVHHGETPYLVNYIYVRQLCHTSAFILVTPLLLLPFCINVLF